MPPGARHLGVKEAFGDAGDSPPWRVAAPSFVLPAGVYENCLALAPLFPEIGLCFFESGACLDYGESDLPPELGRLPVDWHMHLPLDLPWAAGPQAVADVIAALAGKVAGLGPWAYVLHPPQTPGELHALGMELSDRGFAPQRLLVENIQGDDLARLWPSVCELGLGVCLDLGHMLERGQEAFLDLPGLWERTRMLHLNAPDPLRPGRHAPLAALDGAGRALLRRMLARFAPGGTALLELFNPADLFDSLRFLADFQASEAATHREGP